MKKERLAKLAGIEHLNENKLTDNEILYKAVHSAIHPILIKLINDLGGRAEDENKAHDLMSETLRDYISDEL
jgi:hypothetical protein